MTKHTRNVAEERSISVRGWSVLEGNWNGQHLFCPFLVHDYRVDGEGEGEAANPESGWRNAGATWDPDENFEKVNSCETYCGEMSSECPERKPTGSAPGID